MSDHHKRRPFVPTMEQKHKKNHAIVVILLHPRRAYNVVLYERVIILPQESSTPECRRVCTVPFRRVRYDTGRFKQYRGCKTVAPAGYRDILMVTRNQSNEPGAVYDYQRKNDDVRAPIKYQCSESEGRNDFNCFVLSAKPIIRLFVAPI